MEDSGSRVKDTVGLVFKLLSESGISCLLTPPQTGNGNGGNFLWDTPLKDHLFAITRAILEMPSRFLNAALALLSLQRGTEARTRVGDFLLKWVGHISEAPNPLCGSGWTPFLARFATQLDIDKIISSRGRCGVMNRGSPR